MTQEQAIEKVGKLTEELASTKSELETLRKANKEKEEQISTAKTKRDEALTALEELKKTLPAKDSVILSKDEHSSLLEKAKNVDDLSGKVSLMESEKDVRKFAGKYNPDALIAHTPQGAKWEVYETKDADKKDVKALRLKQVVDGKEVTIKLDDFVTQVSKEKFVTFTQEESKSLLDTRGPERGVPKTDLPEENRRQALSSLM